MDLVPLFRELQKEQIQDESSPLFGNFLSERYHPIFPIRREEDNVYFISWILQALERCSEVMFEKELEMFHDIKSRGFQAIPRYRNRYGDKTYNFYRPKAWFPNGHFLSKFGLFQPTDDSDYTSIAYRAMYHTQEDAQEIKEIYQHQSNGLRGRWIERCPKSYRSLRFYNTWIGSEGLFVDMDLVVLSNILIFNSQYQLGEAEEDHASVELIIQAVQKGDHLGKKWALCCWYPFDATILYSLLDLLSLKSYPRLEILSEQLKQESLLALQNTTCKVSRSLLETALLKNGHDLSLEEIEKQAFDRDAESFSFGVIPLLHPFDGQWAQYLSSHPLFHMKYRCRAQCLAIWIERELWKRKKNGVS